MAIQLQITEQSAKEVKLYWTGTDPQFSLKPYPVNLQILEIASKRVREVLQDIASEYTDPRAALNAYVPYLPRLAAAGEALKVALFTPVGGGLLERVLEHFNSRPARTSLSILSDGTVHVPWNFVFVGDPHDLPSPQNSLSDFEDFWGCRFKVNIRFSAADALPVRPIPRLNVKTLLALHRTAFRKAAELLRAQPDVIQKMERLLGRDIGEAADWEDCKKKWKTILDEDSVLYIFAHSDGTKLCLEDEEYITQTSVRSKYELDVASFQALFSKPADSDSNTICFINGCRTADGALGNSFFSVTSGNGFHGFIGAEAEITNNWATRYAVEFLSKLLEDGKSVAEAYEDVRRLCFPISLWYSCYAQPDFRVV